MQTPNYNRGFTLVEAMVSIVLLAVLAVFLLQGVNSAMKYSRDTTCIANLQNVGRALLLHASENNATLLSRQLQVDGKRVYYWFEPLKKGGYVTDFAPKNSIFSCPSGPKSTDRFESYGLRAWDGEAIKRDTELALSRIQNRSEFFLLADSVSYSGAELVQWYTIQKGGHNNGVHLRHRNFAHAFFSDGHVRRASREYFESIHLNDPSLTKDPFEVIESKDK